MKLGIGAMNRLPELEIPMDAVAGRGDAARALPRRQGRDRIAELAYDKISEKVLDKTFLDS